LNFKNPGTALADRERRCISSPSHPRPQPHRLYLYRQ